MKLSNLLMIMVSIQFLLLLFGGNSSTGQTLTEVTTNSTELFKFVVRPFDWEVLDFKLSFLSIATGVVAGIAFVGATIFGKNDLAVFAGAVAVFFGFCMPPIVGLYTLINSEIGFFGESSWIIASMATAPLSILSVTTIFNWWRSAGDAN